MREVPKRTAGFQPARAGHPARRREAAGLEGRQTRAGSAPSPGHFLFLYAPYQSAVDSAGPYALSLEKLWWFFLITCAVVWVVVMVALLVAVLRGMRSRRAGDTPGTEERSGRWVAGAIATTVVILMAFLATSVATGRAVSPLEEATREIKITGHQWWWQIEYGDARADRIAETANELHLPAGERVKLILTSTDVIHSFWVPNLHGKRDLVPGKKAILTIQADRTGIFRGQCAEFCGMQHAKMGLLVVVQPKEEFERWLTRQRAPAAHPRTAEQQRGQQVFLNTSCVMCHAIKGTPAGARTGPDLTHVGSRRTLAAAVLPNNRGNLHGWIANAQSIKPGTVMPPNNYAPEDLHALVAYLESLE